MPLALIPVPIRVEVPRGPPVSVSLGIPGSMTGTNPQAFREAQPEDRRPDGPSGRQGHGIHKTGPFVAEKLAEMGPKPVES